MSDVENILIRSEVFHSLQTEDLERLISMMDEWRIIPGDIIAKAKEDARYFFILKQGALLLELKDDKAVVLSTPGDFVGFELVSSRGIYSTTLTALEEGVVLALPEAEFMDMIQEDSEAANDIMHAWNDYLEKTAPFLVNT